MKTPNEIRRAGIDALMKRLGPANTLRFLLQFDRGHGDYTAERAKLLGDPTVDDLLRELKGKKSKKK